MSLTARDVRRVPRYGAVAWYLYALAGCVAARAALSLMVV